MVQARVGEDFEAGADSATLGVVSAVDKTWDTGLNDGPCTHAAGLDGDVESGICQAVVAEKTGGFAENNHFRMGRGVIVADGAISGTGQNLGVVNENSTNGNFGGFGGGAGFRKSFLHELGVSFHVRRENNMRR